MDEWSSRLSTPYQQSDDATRCKGTETGSPAFIAGRMFDDARIAVVHSRERLDKAVAAPFCRQASGVAQILP